MIERGLYYPSEEYGNLVRKLGGAFGDTKHRPVVCLVKSSESTVKNYLLQEIETDQNAESEEL